MVSPMTACTTPVEDLDEPGAGDLAEVLEDRRCGTGSTSVGRGVVVAERVAGAVDGSTM